MSEANREFKLLYEYAWKTYYKTLDFSFKIDRVFANSIIKHPNGLKSQS